MPSVPASLWAFRVRYNAAYAAHQLYAMAIADAAMAGERPSDALQDSERNAAQELEQAKRHLQTAIAEVLSEQAGDARHRKGG